MLSEHEHVGPVFNLVQGCTYMLVANLFCEGAHMNNPIAKVHAIKMMVEDGTSHELLLVQDTPKSHEKRLPNCVTVAALWNPTESRSSTLLTPTKWPQTRIAQVQLDLELKAVPGQTSSISPTLHFQVCAWFVYVLDP